MSFNKKLDERTKQIVKHWVTTRNKKKIKQLDARCGLCLFRDYGNDSHKVCKRGDFWFRVNEYETACCQFMRKNNELV